MDPWVQKYVSPPPTYPCPASLQVVLFLSAFCKLTICNAVLKYNFEVLYLGIPISCHFILLLHFISEGNILLFTPLHLSYISHTIIDYKKRIREGRKNKTVLCCKTVFSFFLSIIKYRVEAIDCTKTKTLQVDLVNPRLGTTGLLPNYKVVKTSSISKNDSLKRTTCHVHAELQY